MVYIPEMEILSVIDNNGTLGFVDAPVTENEH